jgi:DNA modification methylase
MDKIINKVIMGDCLQVMKGIPDNSIDSIVTDPPAGISFMGKSWDTDKGGRDNWIKWMCDVATECKRVLKPGGHAFVWAIPRTSHWTATAWENAGFEIRDVVAHVFGSGFPKSHNIEKAVQKIQPERSNEFKGIGTALKPAREDWILMRKPLDKGLTIAENCLKYVTGGINIDESRVEAEPELAKNWDRKAPAGFGNGMFNEKYGLQTEGFKDNTPSGRFPANLLHDNSEEVRECFPDAGKGNGKGAYNYAGREYDNKDTSMFNGDKPQAPSNFNDSGNASRFFRAIPNDVVDYNDFLIYNRSILTNIKQLCGQHLTKKKTDTILDGVIQEAEKFIQDAELLIFGNSKMEKFLTDTASTIKTLIAQMTELKTLNVLPNWLIMKFTEDYEKTIKLLKELNTEDVKNAESINRLIAFKREMLELIRDIARNVVIENYENGKLQTENELMLTPENINENTKKNIGERKSFKSIIYQAKASKSERNRGCEKLEEKPKVFNGQSDKPSTDMKDVEKRFTTLPKANNHPTVKPIALMEYLIKMVTPKGGIVLDPFAGSGSTLVAAKQNGFQYIGIELTEEYIPIIEARLSGVENDLFKDIL